MPTSVTASSIGNYPVNCNWRGGSPTSLAVVTGSTTMTSVFSVQYTFDDLQLSSSPFWFGISTTAGFTSSASTFQASAIYDTGWNTNLVFPVGGVRLTSTAISSSSLIFKVMQGESW